MSEIRLIIHSEAELSTVAKLLIGHAESCKIFCLSGDLGAGKTSLVKAIASELNVEDSISSPTYSIINEYIHPLGKIFHMDLYRLNSIEEAIDIGIEDYLFSGDYVFIEWPDIIIPILPAHHTVNIEVLDDYSRKIVLLTK